MTERLNLVSHRRNLCVGDQRPKATTPDGLALRGPRYRIERPQSPPKGAAGRLGEVRHFGNIANSFEAVVTLARRFARQRV
jgi:hypothetical protein